MPAQLFTAICPAGEEGFNDVKGFFNSYLALPVVAVFWLGGFIWKRQGWLRTHQIDVDKDRRELPWDEINEYKARIAKMPRWKRIIHTLFI